MSIGAPSSGALPAAPLSCGPLPRSRSAAASLALGGDRGPEPGARAVAPQSCGHAPASAPDATAPLPPRAATTTAQTAITAAAPASRLPLLRRSTMAVFTRLLRA